MKYRRVLLVDDDAQYLRLLTTIIANDHMTIYTATSAERALQILQEQRCDLMITDLQMPGMDGCELSLLAQRLNPELEIVLFTGAAGVEVSRKAMEAGISRVYSKPCRVQELLALVRTGKEKSQPGDTAKSQEPQARDAQDKV